MKKSVVNLEEINILKTLIIYFFIVFSGILLIYIIFKLNPFSLKRKCSALSHDTTSCGNLFHTVFAL